MKFPSVFRTASPMRFDIKPRYYDPVREEIEQRTSRIKKELEADGLIEQTNDNGEARYSGSSIRGAFSQSRGIKERSQNPLTTTGMIRLFIVLVLLGTIGGYIYLGPVFFEYGAYALALILSIYLFFRLKPKRVDE